MALVQAPPAAPVIVPGLPVLPGLGMAFEYDDFLHALTAVDLQRRMELGQIYRAALPLLVELAPMSVMELMIPGTIIGAFSARIVVCSVRARVSARLLSYIYLYITFCVYVAVHLWSRF